VRENFRSEALAEAIGFFFNKEYESLAALIMMHGTPLPESPQDMLAFIAETEQRKKVVWTRLSFVSEAGLWARLEGLSWKERAAVRKRLRMFLEELADEGCLRRREGSKETAFDDDSSFDYVRSEKELKKATKADLQKSGNASR